VRWRREWVYQLGWAPGYIGVLSRGVDSPAKIRAAMEWARRNPHVETGAIGVSTGSTVRWSANARPATT
jgi:hypothetical protein